MQVLLICGRFNSGNTVPVRSGSFSAVGTWGSKKMGVGHFPPFLGPTPTRVPPRNYPLYAFLARVARPVGIHRKCDLFVAVACIGPIGAGQVLRYGAQGEGTAHADVSGLERARQLRDAHEKEEAKVELVVVVVVASLRRSAGPAPSVTPPASRSCRDWSASERRRRHLVLASAASERSISEPRRSQCRLRYRC